MFTDIVGFTAFGQADEDRSIDLLARQRRLLRPLIAQFNGTEIKTIGDSLWVEFASDLDATKCAVRIQRDLHDFNAASSDDWKIWLRIGIHVGDVIRQTGDILGDAVNVASRIESLAEPEGVCVSESVFDHSRRRSSWIPIGTTLGCGSLDST